MPGKEYTGKKPTLTENMHYLELQLSYALYLGIQTICITLPNLEENEKMNATAEIARTLYRYLALNPQLKVIYSTKFINSTSHYYEILTFQQVFLI